MTHSMYTKVVIGIPLVLHTENHFGSLGVPQKGGGDKGLATKKKELFSGVATKKELFLRLPLLRTWG